ncbi:MAG: aldo/keto reductase [Candidatus Marinimicrobia bacterium]|jgi:aryl-alcohol dehydrogenase-like predicted oxidoreductase|nr:aldo/keto reductase [Candidatus Neomarinimicrobiota bacterium]MDD4961436.1 aldo/keto reductase [Candidatus Neomarinimicrobiota bacterium]MDD5709439.1 aldo/keto reductase [Candidatus Neomarinimicrobiota bacterium]MDX9778205.1 aldo/keto reductase [bacterium]
MQYTRLGERGPRVSTIGFGAWAIGGMNWGKTDDEISKTALRKAIENGVTFIDTADVYGFGHSEELIRSVIEEMGVKDKIVVATKAGNDFYNATENDDAGYGTIRQNADYDYIISAAEKSLKRLNLEALDILQLHSPDTEKLQRDDPWRALEKLKRDGKIKHAGWSVQSFGETTQAFLLDEHKDLLDVIQVRYNLLEREAEELLFKKSQQYGIGVIVRIPLLFGFLTGKFNKNARFDREDHRSMNLSPDKLEKYLRQLEQMQPLYDKYPEQSKAQLALRFCITHPAAHVAIPGAKTEKQVLDNIAASDFGPLPLSDIPVL